MASSASLAVETGHMVGAVVMKSTMQGVESTTRMRMVIAILTTIDDQAQAPALPMILITTIAIPVAMPVATQAEVEDGAMAETVERPVDDVMSAITADVDDRARQAVRLVRVVTQA